MTNRDDKLPQSGNDKSEDGDRFNETIGFSSVPSKDSEGPRSLDASSDETRNIGPYRLLEKIGEGGMGTVWMAEQQEPVRRRVALKLIKVGVDNKQVSARFEAERQAIAMMNHENIAKILDAGTTETGQPYFVMELIQGIPLNKYCDKNNLSIRDRLELFTPICKAVQHAHQKGIIHRDLKPSNVLVCFYDGIAVPKVIDFGLAKALEPTMHLTDKTMFTEFGQVVGTLQYMSPEQAELNQLDIDTRTDVYSLGVMLYELLTGSTPIEQETMKDAAILKILEVIREKEPPRPSVRLSSSTNESVTGISSQRQIDPNKLKNILRGELDWIVMKALEKDRTRRYETADGLAADVNRYLNDEPVVARSPSASYRLQKFVHRNRGLVVSGAAITALLLLAIVGTGWGMYQARRNAQRAEARESQAIEAVKRFGDAVAESPELRNNPSLQKLRMTLLREPMVFFRNLRDQLQADADSRPESLARLGEISYTLGSLNDTIGDNQVALDAYRESAELFQKLVDDDPMSNQLSAALADCYLSLGTVLENSGRQKEALEAYAKTLVIRNELIELEPSVTDHVRDVALTHNNIGISHKAIGNIVRAEASNQAALAFRKQLVDAHPDDSGFKRDLARSQYNVAVLQNENGRAADARASFEMALETQRNLAQLEPDNATIHGQLAATYFEAGNLAYDTDDDKSEALALYQAGLEIQKKLVETNPSVAQYQSGLAYVHNLVGLLFKNTDEQAKARNSFLEALSLNRALAAAHPTVTRYQCDVATVHSNMGTLFLQNGALAEALASYDAAEPILKQLVEANPETSRFQLELAGLYSNLASALRALGRESDARASSQAALEIQKRLAIDQPDSPQMAYIVGATIHNMALSEVREGRLEQACKLLREAIDWQKKAINTNPENSTYRNCLAAHLSSLAEALRNLDRENEAADAERELAELAGGH